MSSSTNPVIVQPGQGEQLLAFGEALSILLGSSQTGGQLTVMLNVTQPGGGPPLHVHAKEDELFLVIEGRISYFANGTWTEVGPGGAVFLPRGSTHCYRNVGTSPSKQWILATPSGFERFFSQCAEESSKSPDPDMNRILEICSEHGIQILGDPPKPGVS